MFHLFINVSIITFLDANFKYRLNFQTIIFNYLIIYSFNSNSTSGFPFISWLS